MVPSTGGVLSPCLPNVYQKRRKTLGTQGLCVFPFPGCLPNVYQGNFFTSKEAVFACFGGKTRIKFRMQGALYFSAEKSGALPPVFARFFAEMHKPNFGKRTGTKIRTKSLTLLQTGRSTVSIPMEKSKCFLLLFDGWRRGGTLLRPV